MQKKQLVYNNARLHYSIMGIGKPVVLLHGFAEDSSIWNDLAAALSKNYQLIIPDIAGSGQSEMLAGNNIGMEDYADSIHHYYQENIEQCTMIGHSMGGYITLAFAEKYPACCMLSVFFTAVPMPMMKLKKQPAKKPLNSFIKTEAMLFLKPVSRVYL